MKLPVQIVSAASTVGRCLKANAPKILMGVGIVSTVAALVDAVKQTPIAIEHMEAHKEEIEKIKTYKSENHDDYTPAMYKKDIFGAYVRTVGDLINDYKRPIILEAVGLACLVGAGKIFDNRYKLAEATAASAINSALADRRKVAEAIGQEEADKIFNGVVEQKVTEEVLDENGKAKKVHSKRSIVDPKNTSPYSFLWIEGDPFWDPIPEFNYNRIHQVEDLLNRPLFGEKHDDGRWIFKPVPNAFVSLNDIRRHFKPASEVFTQIGQIAGCTADHPDGRLILRYKDVSIPDPQNPHFFLNAILITPNLPGSLCPDYVATEE